MRDEKVDLWCFSATLSRLLLWAGVRPTTDGDFILRSRFKVGGCTLIFSLILPSSLIFGRVTNMKNLSVPLYLEWLPLFRSPQTHDFFLCLVPTFTKFSYCHLPLKQSISPLLQVSPHYSYFVTCPPLWADQEWLHHKQGETRHGQIFPLMQGLFCKVYCQPTGLAFYLWQLLVTSETPGPVWPSGRLRLLWRFIPERKIADGKICLPHQHEFLLCEYWG